VRVPPPRGRHGGQCEIDLRFATLTRMADQVMTYKYVVKNVARARQDGDVHAEADLRRQRLGHAHHQSLWKEGATLMADPSATPGCRSSRALRRRPARARARRCSPSAPRRRTRTAGSSRATRRRSTSSTRSATARRASASRCTPSSPKAKRIEFRCPGSGRANPYLAFSAC
jgi:glutamine synthetase